MDAMGAGAGVVIGVLDVAVPFVFAPSPPLDSTPVSFAFPDSRLVKSVVGPVFESDGAAADVFTPSPLEACSFSASDIRAVSESVGFFSFISSVETGFELD